MKKDWFFYLMMGVGFWAIISSILYAQQDDPLLHRATSTKTVLGRVRLVAGEAIVRLNRADQFTDVKSYTVNITFEDSTSIMTPNSARAFGVKFLDKNRFRIRSVTIPADTIRVRWQATGN